MKKLLVLLFTLTLLFGCTKAPVVETDHILTEDQTTTELEDPQTEATTERDNEDTESDDTPFGVFRANLGEESPKLEKIMSEDESHSDISWLYFNIYNGEAYLRGGGSAGYYYPASDRYVQNSNNLIYAPLDKNTSMTASYMQLPPNYIVSITDSYGTTEETKALGIGIGKEFGIIEEIGNDDQIYIKDIIKNADTGNLWVLAYFDKRQEAPGYFSESQHILIELGENYAVIKVIPLGWGAEYAYSMIYIGNNQLLLNKAQAQKVPTEDPVSGILDLDTGVVIPTNNEFLDKKIESWQYLPLRGNTIFGSDEEGYFFLTIGKGTVTREVVIPHQDTGFEPTTIESPHGEITLLGGVDSVDAPQSATINDVDSMLFIGACEPYSLSGDLYGEIFPMEETYERGIFSIDFDGNISFVYPYRNDINLLGMDNYNHLYLNVLTEDLMKLFRKK